CVARHFDHSVCQEGHVASQIRRVEADPHGCIQPMSSPMMKRMLGFACCCCCCCCCCACCCCGGTCCCRCCAVAGRLTAIPTAMNASRASHNFCEAFMISSLWIGSCGGRSYRATPAPFWAGGTPRGRVYKATA